jgi:hypothetical protein
MKLRIRQMLLETTSQDGTQFGFAVLDDNRFAILRDGAVDEVGESDDETLGRGIKRYFALLDECGGSRHPFQADAPQWHPHAG